MRGWIFDSRGYRDVWLVITTVMALWAVLLTYSTVNENHRSLCAWRADLEHRVDNGVAFQRAHPHGAYGFSPALIAKSISDQRRTISAFRHLNCKQ